MRALGVPLSPHDVVIQRANAALARLDPRLAQAKANGATSFLRQDDGRIRLLGCRGEGRGTMAIIRIPKMNRYLMVALMAVVAVVVGLLLYNWRVVIFITMVLLAKVYPGRP